MSNISYEYWTAIGTLSSALLALTIALTQAGVAIYSGIKRKNTERLKTASLIFAWIEHRYEPNSTGEYYRRSVILHLANESDEPVFNVSAVCGVSHQGTYVQLGPLAAPTRIPALPAKREFTYDVTTGFLAFGTLSHDSLNGLVARVSFNDHQGNFWNRSFDGQLTKQKSSQNLRIEEANNVDQLSQVGDIESPYNPLSYILMLSNLAADERLSDSDFRSLLSKDAPGWKEANIADIRQLRTLLTTKDLALHVKYPTPRIAYVRLIDGPPGNEMQVQAHILTLVWGESNRWTLFGVGPFHPWDIPFGRGELFSDILDGREHP